MKKIIICLLMCFIVSGCSSETKINQEYIDKIVMEKEYILLDVRTKEEYELLHVNKSINLPVDEINEEIKVGKDKIIFVYCKSGNRSSMAYSKLTSLGYTVYDLGGIDNIDLEKNR